MSCRPPEPLVVRKHKCVLPVCLALLLATAPSQDTPSQSEDGPALT